MSLTGFTVLAVSTNERLLDVLPKLLGRQEMLEYRGCVPGAAEALALAERDAPHVIVSDLAPATARDILLWRSVCELGPRLIVLTRYLEQGIHVRSMLAGASGLLLVPERKLAEAVLSVAAGEGLPRQEAAGYLRTLLSGESPNALSVPERRILALVTDGRSDYEIASRLETSPDIVREYIAQIAEKLL